MSSSSRSWLLFGIIAVVWSLLVTRGLIAQPGFTDAFYHFNAANRLVSGQGLTEDYLWTYIAAPDSLPTASHRYWMPLTSLTAAFGMGILNAPGDYYAAQLPFTLMLVATGVVGFWLGGALGGTLRHAWVAGLLTLFSGFFTRFWGSADTFAPYALVGSVCLVALGHLGRDSQRYWVWAVFGGVFAALGHLTRADGLLLLLVGWVVLLWLWGAPKAAWRRRLAGIVLLTGAYLLVMSPWFFRNLNVVGTPLPVGGTQGIWLTEYNDLFNYPADANPQALFADGIELFLATRWEAIVNNLGTFVGVEGLVVLTPFMLVGLWRRRGDGFLRAFWVYALGLHLAMTFVFPFPGYRGGLFHSAAALIPWWAALGVVGLDDIVDWIARRRRRWNPRTAKLVFSAALVGFALYLSVTIALQGRVTAGTPRLYTELTNTLPDDVRVMINDPAQLYYFTGLGGVVLPNERPQVIPEIARRYSVEYLLLETITIDGQVTVAAPGALATIINDPPDFLTEIPLEIPNARLYAIAY